MKTETYNIEQNIPIPGWGNRGKWRKLAESMGIGDSVEVNGRLEAMNLRNAIHRLGFKAITRGNDKPRTRVWKVEK